MIKGQEKKILIVDREGVTSMRFWGEVCPSPGFNTMFAVNAENAFALFTTHHHDLIVIRTDIEKDHGRDLCRKVRIQEGQRHTGIIFWDKSQIASESLVVECLESGADDFLNAKCSPAEASARIRAVLRLKGMTDDLRSANHRLQMLSLTDELTGLANMRCFNNKFLSALKLCKAGHGGLGVLMLDLDHFKSVNDSSNHLIGSYVISEVGKLIRTSGIFEDRDVAARYGGDEFIIFCPCDDLSQLLGKAEELRFRIRQAKFQKDGVSVRITASLGAAYVEAGYSGRGEAPIKAADLMLYRSKGLGRDRVSAMILHEDTELRTVERFVESGESNPGAIVDSRRIAGR